MHVSVCVCVCGRVAGCHNDIIIYINEISAISQKRKEEERTSKEYIGHIVSVSISNCLSG